MEIAGISPGERTGRDMGDLGPLMACIAGEGLKHPVTVGPTGRLILGARRLEACRRLGWTSLDAETVTTVQQALDRMREDSADACCTHPLTVIEAIHMDFAVRELEWWERGAPPPPGSTRRDGRREMMAAMFGFGNGRQYGIARLLVLAARGHRVEHGVWYPVSAADRERAEAALAIVQAPSDLNAALRLYETGTRHLPPSPPGPPRRLPVRSQMESVGSALAALAGITTGLAGAAPLDPATPAEVVRRWERDITQAIQVLNRLRKELRNHDGYRDGDNDRD